MNLVIMGPPGAGKGTICNKIIKEYNYKLICAGDLLREEKASGSELGKEIASIIDAGNLVPDRMITDIILRELKNPIKQKTFYLIDGYPRTKKQAQSLDGMLNIKNVIWLNVSEETTIKRNLERGKTSKRPDDSSVEVIEERLREYNKVSKELKGFYKGRLTEIDGEGTIDEVYYELIKSIIK